MNIRLFRWSRALELAINNKTHVDTVLFYRKKFLTAHNRSEKEPRFKQYFDEVEIDEEKIMAKKAEERESEARSGEGKSMY